MNRIMMSTSEGALAHKTNVCAAHRSSATRLMNQADSQMEATLINTDELALLQTNLSAQLMTLEILIVELIPEAQLEQEIKRADEYTKKIQSSLLRIHKTLLS